MTSNAQKATGELVTAKRAVEISGLSYATLAMYRTAGGGPPFYKVGHHVRYDDLELRQWLRSRRFTSTSEYNG